MQNASVTIIEPVGSLSQIGCEPGKLVSKVVPEGGPFVTNRDRS